MAYSLSGRPDTSEPAASNETQLPSRAPQTTLGQEGEDGPYVPHVFDFVTLAAKAARIAHLSIPSLFLESQAVDTSTLIGDGASFSASRRRLPQTERLDYTVRTESSTVTASLAAGLQPQYVVYKTTRVAFTPAGEPVPKDRTAMSSAMMELYALIHKPLYEHPNVIQYLGLAWGSNPFEPSHQLPVIVVEYAEHGTLSDLQNKESVPPALMHSLCLDIALGLDILHRCGIVHGDVKAENVLIFSDAKKKYVAKVADFGFSVVAMASQSTINLGGTRPWKAPETRFPIPKAEAQLTDVYSFGLLAWRVANGGGNPFDNVIPESFKGEEREAEIERIKDADELVVRAQLQNWFISHLRRLEGKISSFIRPGNFFKEPQNFTSDTALTPTVSEDSDPLQVTFGFQISGPSDTVDKAILRKVLQTPLYSCFDTIMEYCLAKLPASRDLTKVITVLQSGMRPEPTPSDQLSQAVLLQTSYNHHVISWQQMRDLEPSVQAFIFSAFVSSARKNAEESKVNPPQCFALASFYINGYGTELDYEEAVRLLSHAAKWGHEPSNAYLYRVCRALDANFGVSEAVINQLARVSLQGSRTALEDLNRVGPDNIPFITTSLKTALAGVGANFYSVNQMYYGLTHGYWMKVFEDKARLSEKLGSLDSVPDFKVNRRGDRILHMAASCGRLLAIQILVDEYSVDVNQRNDQGETPLLCACRAGQVEVAHFLMSREADASAATPHNESALHWLISFQGEDVETIGLTLLACGADIRLTTTRNTSHSGFPGGIDVDHQAPGTPLTWAVHHNRPDIVQFLLEWAQDPSICLTKAMGLYPPALGWAAHYHHVECLKLMVTALEEARTFFTYNELIAAAAHSADVFSMILRHGLEYKVRLEATFDYLLSKSKTIYFSTGIGSFGNTLLYFAVSEAHDAVVEYLLSSDVEHALALVGTTSQEDEPLRPAIPDTKEAADVDDAAGAFLRKHVNKACGPDKRTPLLEAVRWNRRPIAKLLLEHGADAKATSRNPFFTRTDWTALHVFAHAGHDANLELVRDLIDNGVPVDGREADNITTETPLTVAIKSNSFRLASALFSHGASMNALSLTSGFLVADYPMTVLGHIIASTARHSTSRLRYILFDCPTHDEVDFVVEPERKLTALHRAAWAYHDLSTTRSGGIDPMCREDCDMTTNREIMYELLTKFNTAEHLNMRCQIHRRTALHLAVEVGNVCAVSELVGMGADMSLEDEMGKTPLSFAESLLPRAEDAQWTKAEMEEIIHTLRS